MLISPVLWLVVDDFHSGDYFRKFGLEIRTIIIKISYLIDICSQDLLEETFKKDANVLVIPMSTLTKEGVSEVQNTACDALLAHRIEQKMAGNKVSMMSCNLCVHTARQN